ncbi:MAG TPA: AMP-binding protein [Gaiellaceae bacterium]|nr:AMP-binding protein [Gaiellaceae bacterium]
MKGLRIGRRRGRSSAPTSSPVEIALTPALKDERWHVPDHFNFTRDVVEVLARDPKRRALTSLGKDGVIEPRSFMQISEGVTRWASILREHGVRHEDRVVVLADSGLEWLEVVLAVMKVGAITVPCAPTLTAAALEVRISATEPALLVAERSVQPAIEQMTFTADVHYLDDGPARRASDVPEESPTHNTSSRDLAFVFSTPGTAGASKGVAHTHASVFASRVAAAHWLDAGPGDAVWFPVPCDSAHAVWNALVGPWSCGAEVVLDHGEFDARERLDLLYRLGPTIVCQSPAEYRALAGLRELERYRSPRLRRLVSTGDYLEPEIVEAFEERWGMTIHDGYGQTETNIVVANSAESDLRPGSLGRALPGHHVAIIDAEGNELPVGIEGDLAVRGRPPTLFAGYWESPEETKSAFRGDWYLTGDVARTDEEGYFWFVGRAEDVITSSGRTFGPYDVERVLREHPAISVSAVIGLRDLQRGGQFVRAYVVLARGGEGSAEREAELRQFVGEALPEQQIPREIVFVDELPTVRGQVSRHLLREHPVGGRPLWEQPQATETETEPTVVATEPPPPQVVAEAAPAVESEPIATPAQESEPQPVEPPLVASEQLVEAIPARPDEPDSVVLPSFEPVAEPVPVPTPEPELEPVAEASPLLEPQEPEPQIEPVVEVSPQPEPEPESIVREPQPEPVAETAPALASEPLETRPEPEHVPVHTPEFSSAPEPAPLPNYVVEPPEHEPAELPVEPAPEPEPVASIAPEPLPDFIIPPGTTEPPPPPPAPEPEDEVDLGPLPDYVVDPDRPRGPTLPEPEWSAPLPTPKPLVEASGKPDAGTSSGLQFPSAASFPAPRSDEDGEAEFGRDAPKAPRGRSAAGGDRPKRVRSRQAEPGDESEEVSWMEGLSNRLSAYSLAADEAEPPTEPKNDDPEDADASS